jgi:hypothetical protein
MTIRMRILLSKKSWMVNEVIKIKSGEHGVVEELEV